MAIQPLHTRFRFAPTGDVHLGHATLCWLSYLAARQTGGTFVYRVEQLKAYMQEGRRQNYETWVRKNIDDLCAICPPTDGNVLSSFPGMHPSFRIQITDDRSLIDHYYRKLGYEAIYGEWPQQIETTSQWSKNFHYGNYEQGWTHPYILFAQTVGDIATGRNCLIRGMDLRFEAAMINAMGQVISKEHHQVDEIDILARRTFTQHYVPLIKRSGTMLPEDLRKPEGVALSASQPQITSGFYVRDVLERDIEPDELFRYLGKVLFGSIDAADRTLTGWADERLDLGIIKADDPVPNTQTFEPDSVVHTRVKQIVDKINPNPVIEDEDWFRFLKIGKVEE
jgi:hypothetical protein